MFQYRHLVQRICSPIFTKQCDRYSVQAAQILSSVGVTNNEKLYSTLTYKGTQKPLVQVRTVPATKIFEPCRNYAARKGTRARKAAKKVAKKVEVKQPFMFSHLRKLAELPYTTLRPRDESNLPDPVDDVYFSRKFRTQNYEFNDIVQKFRETHHPTVYNVPNAPLYLRVNLDMKYPNRATKFMDGWRSVIEMKQPFLLDGMTRPSVLAFCIEDLDYIDNVLKAGGADLAGGKEIIKGIQAGDINPDEYEYLVAHPSVVPDLAAIRGLIKKKFPTVKNRTISTDLVSEVKRLKSGVKVQAIKNEREPDFGYLETPIGTLDMDGLIHNFLSVMEDTLPRRVSGKLPEDFVISCVLKTPGNGFEEFNVDKDKVFNELECLKSKKKVSEVADD